MSRRQWTGLAGLLFGLTLLAGVVAMGTTPDASGDEAIQRYTDYWTDEDNQSAAALGGIILTYSCVLLLLFAAGLRSLLGLSGSALAHVVLGAGAAAAATLATGTAVLTGVGLAGARSGYVPSGSEGLLVESVGVVIGASAVMMAATMAMAFSLANRTARVAPQWTMVLSALLALAALGSVFTAPIAFLLLPLWSVVMGLCLIASRGTEPAATDPAVTERAVTEPGVTEP